ncbi:hypothetical protein B0H17DRAFT_1219877 [Mycena rosella]|uniref:Uncharacterized protein n=1 Tax=Mycena rosella TaxID=1033263 RepID=A0AAD7FEC3_MYCRO|nr:hypothetical protein B0H17DRAFT_1219877 [Mycena rosella]
MDFIQATQLQTVMSSVRLPGLSSAPSLLLVPAYCTGISAFILLLHSVLSLGVVDHLLKRARIISEQPSAAPPPGIGKGVILGYRVVRLLGCFGLLALSVVSIVYVGEDVDGTRRDALIWRVLMGVPYVSSPVFRF